MQPTQKPDSNVQVQDLTVDDADVGFTPEQLQGEELMRIEEQEYMPCTSADVHANWAVASEEEMAAMDVSLGVCRIDVEIGTALASALDKACSDSGLIRQAVVRNVLVRFIQQADENPQYLQDWSFVVSGVPVGTGHQFKLGLKTSMMKDVERLSLATGVSPAVMIGQVLNLQFLSH